MGEVYLARDSRLDRKVALKILPDALAADPDRMMRFEQEAKAASALNHPNIITIYEIDRSGSISFIATEFIAKQPDNIEVPPTRALLLASRGDFHAAEIEIPGILHLHPSKDPLYHHAAYDIACIYALEGKSVEAVRWLKESAAAGYHLYPRYTRDAIFDPIRQSPEFVQFLSGMKAEHDRYQHEFS